MKILVLGASGHVGSAAVSGLRGRHELIEASRSTSPSVDLRDAERIAALFDEVGELDAVVCCVGEVPFKPLAELSADDYRDAFVGKVLAQLDVVRLATPHLRDGGSITLTTGILAREPIAAGAAASMANGAVESFVLAAATELPRGIRLNAVSPNVLASATGYHDAFPGFVPVSDEAVGMAYRKAVEGVQTGQVFTV